MLWEQFHLKKREIEKNESMLKQTNKKTQTSAQKSNSVCTVTAEKHRKV